MQRIDFVRLARGVYHRWLRSQRKVGEYYPTDRATWRKVDAQIADAQLDGFAEAISRLPFIPCNTPAAVWMDVQDAVLHVTAEHGERPSWQTVNNDKQNAWDDEVLTFLITRWMPKEES